MKHPLAAALLFASACASASVPPADTPAAQGEAGLGLRGTAAPEAARPADASAGPALSNDAIREVIRAHSPEVQRCYQRALARDPNRRGRVLVAFVIGTDGHVLRSSVAESTLGDADAESCIAGVVSGLAFPRPSRGIVEARYPFELRPVDRDRDGLD